MNEWPTVSQLMTIAVVSMPFAVVLGPIAAWNVYKGKEFGIWQVLAHFGWLFTHAFVLISWPIVLFASMLGMQSLASAMERWTTGVGVFIGITIIAVSLLPYMVIPFRKK